MSTTTLSVCVARKSIEALQICTFELVGSNGRPLPSFSAGSHIDVQVTYTLTRQYSLCNDPAETHRYLIGVLHDPNSRGGSAAMHERVKEGDTLTISAPKNHFPLVRDASRHVLLAGGIGVTPILCMAERLKMVDADFEMHYCTRSRERTAFHSRIMGIPLATKVHFHFDDDEATSRFDVDRLLAIPQQGTHLYVCGPKGFMDAVLGFARRAGWPEAQVHYEFFGAEVAKSNDDASFDVQLASTGKIVPIPKDKTVVQALADVGVSVPVSCEQGVCGTCLTRVLEGVPDHKDMFLTIEERSKNDQFLPCCSRSRSARLVLDL